MIQKHPPQDLLVDPVHEGLEHLERLFLVLDQGIALAVAAQADAFLQVVERVEVVLPLRVHDLQHDHALVEEHQLRPDLPLLLLVEGLDAGVEGLLHLHAAQSPELVQGHVEPVGLLEGEAQPVVVPLVGVLSAHVGLEVPLEHFPGQAQDVLAGVLALQDHAAHVVDGRALLVHHVVVLEQVLADGEVLRLHLLLRALDRLGDHPVLDGDALLHAQLQHQAADAVGAEDAHEVVFQREVEP